MLKKFFVLFFLLVLASCESVKVPYQKTEDITYEPYDEIEEEDLIAEKKDKLVVALLLPLTGKAERVGKSMLQAAEMSMFEDRFDNIVIMPFDTKGTAFGAVEAINSAIRNGVDIVVGPLFTQTTKAILDITEANDLIVLSFSDNQSLLNGGHSNLYLMGLTPQQEIYKIITHLIEYRGDYGFSAMLPNDAYGNSALQDFKDVIFRKDAKIVKTEFYSKKDSNLQKKVDNLLNSYSIKEEVYEAYTEALELAKTEETEEEVEFLYEDEDKIFSNALLLPDGGEDLIKIGEYVYNSNLENKPTLIGTSKWLNSNLFNNYMFDGALFASPSLDSYAEYEKLYINTFNSFPIRISSLAYDAIKVLTRSYAKADDKENIKYAIENYQGFEGANGKFRFLSNGLLERRLAVIKISSGTYEIISYDDEPFLKY